MPRHLTSDAHEWINEIPSVPRPASLNLSINDLYVWILELDYWNGLELE